ncbi:hypothetical protein BOTBODRAFT_46182 [Botryobasidium botryosum FD-172 SS1]|uniref:Uncharacterized protein n=1 Tax=Botryobasidium botryosum (strain FD-172 SS1) TaxID=930990 RepID=A0A067MJ99_BOTB1|nr:hypothetical protein BOTBODRAFT_46182 [Botryobasidium botryosum FD-172 SS1]
MLTILSGSEKSGEIHQDARARSSKLLCFACRIFFQFHNQRAPEFGQTPFYFKGAHWKLYTGGWAYVRVKAGAPDSVNGLLGRVREDMTANLKTRIQERVRAQAKRRVVSNSTVASTTPRSVIIGGESDIKETCTKKRLQT